VEFVIVGGLAATIHGSSRLTQDIDVVYGRSRDDLTRVTAVIRTERAAARPKDLDVIAEHEALSEESGKEQ
jgi:hypothetical protein